MLTYLMRFIEQTFPIIEDFHKKKQKTKSFFFNALVSSYFLVKANWPILDLNKKAISMRKVASNF